MKYVIFDLDGTLADIEARRKKAMKPDKSINWGSFFNPNNIVLDKPMEDVLELYHLIRLKAGYKVAIFSGRSDITEEATIAWFKYHNIIPPEILKMRKDGDYTPDQDLKKQWMEELLEEEMITKNDIAFTVDDRNKVVKMWRNEGLTCLQVAEGDF